MEVLATLKAYVKKTGANLGKVDVIVGCCNCDNLDEFTDKHGKDIAEYLYNRLICKINAVGVSFWLCFVELEDEADKGEEIDIVNSVFRWF